ncbi:hypothetical protein PTE_01713 [Photorhabdus khanii NC19]|uniref:Uncharacterized protein n=1 Tax=Photorhabdus khanii NC19 TaxID=1004151 RepID=W3V7Y8_9GAMM|nr:hypothetical protein [Photorhabdus khanii]ETS31957.1 hypothetical protein PTE_01713 [Photorhabdus khanii NC19]
MVQKLKRGQGFSSAYKPSVLVNQARIIVAQTVDPVSETRVIAETQKHAILLFCPEGNDRQSPRKIYPKSRFIYHAEKDLYICPANDRLRHVSTVRPSEKSRGHRVYTGANCADCLEKEKKDACREEVYPDER